jgi:hypothetical protein
MKRFAVLVVAATLVAGCNSAGSTPFGLAPSASRSSVLSHSAPPRSWMAPDAKRRDLLYVSDFQNNEVSVFSYPKGDLMGTLTGFLGPYGECADPSGNVYIANDKPPEVLEYAHGGTAPIATIKDPGEYAYSCAYDPTTGDLAITNEYSRNSTHGGSVSIYRHGRGKPHTYAVSGVFYMYFASYDDKGNLFVDGLPLPTGGIAFAELPKGGTTFKPITLNVNIQFAGGVQWDGSHIAVGDQANPVIYQFSISGSKGTEVGSTPLNGAKEVAEFWKQGRDVAAPDTYPAYLRVGLWKYPAGGSDLKYLYNNFGLPVAATVSRAKSAQ